MKTLRRLGFSVLFCFLGSLQAGPNPSGSVLNSAPLLDQSYHLSQVLGGREQREQLYYLVEFCRLDGQLKQPWEKTKDAAWTLFQNASNEQEARLHTAGQKNAATCLSYVDPTAAMDVLGRVNLQRPVGGNWLYEDPRYNAAGTTFTNFLFLARVTPQAVSDVIVEARNLGQTGQYPYVAAAEVMNRLPASFKSDINTLLNDALSAYSTETGFYNRDEEFLRFLQSVKNPSVDKTVLARALSTFVQRLVNDPIHIPGDYYAEIHSNSGKVFPFIDRNEAFLFQAFPLIRRFNPPLAAQLRQQDPKLDQATEHMSYISGGFFQGDPESPEAAQRHLEWLQDSLVDRIKQIQARPDCDQGVAARLFQRLSDPASRIDGFSAAVPGIARTNPTEARNLFATQLSQLGGLDDPGKLRAMVALVSAASYLGDLKQYESMSAQAFDLGIQLFNQDASARHAQAHAGFAELAELAKFSASQPADVLTAKIQQLPDNWLKAYLLLYQAAGHAQQKAAQTSSGACPY